IIGHRDFVRQNPVATKRAMRAILKTADLCALAPERQARALVDKGWGKQYEYAFQMMQDLPYGQWRNYNPEDTVRFYALRLREAGAVGFMSLPGISESAYPGLETTTDPSHP